ncbi:hypothetical protein ACIA5G_33520 [Amycolatopsis sp. NPDC051758]|uniref:hypothetical protein n=1 Tax=Amycolatopsis sp. NPDC051758 TaxID=3363935 RepID=UPI0037B0A3A0
MSWAWKTTPLGETATDACRLAAEELRPHEILSTGRVLFTLSRMDIHGNWDRIWGRTGTTAPALSAVEDQDQDQDQVHQATTWHGVRVSGDLARSLSLAAEIATGQGMSPIPAGLLAFALLADENAGAARTLLAGGEIGHDELLALVEHDLLRPHESLLPLEEPERDEGWVERTERLSRPRRPDDLDLLAVLIDSGAIGRAGNNRLLTQARAELADKARLFGTRPATSIVESAQEEFGVMAPDAHQVVFALADRPSPALTAVLSVAGVTPRQLAAWAMTELDETTRRRVNGDVRVWSIANLALLVATAVLIVRHAMSGGDWWELGFLLIVFLGPPAVTAWFPAACAVGLAVFNPVAAVVLSAEALVSWLRERTERGALTARTGVRLTLAEYRAFVARGKDNVTPRDRFDVTLAPLRAARLQSRVAKTAARAQP